MKFVALVSGGKDSCYNIMHCLNAGHELVAMANLHPRANRPDEIDSYMFQTVGYKTVEAIAQCAGVPLFRATISENEDAVVDEMAALFRKIKAACDFDAVSAGAIGSTYQQVRVDRACSLVGLRSLTYLWQRDQAELLREIVASGLDARIIKVAGMGLGERHLGKPLREVQDELIDMHAQFGLHPCGEGGEYETMVFDAPFFNCKRLVIVPGTERVVAHSTDDVFYLEFDVSIETHTEPPRLIEVSVPPLIGPEVPGATELAELADTAVHPASVHGIPALGDEWPNVGTLPESARASAEHLTFSAHGTFNDTFAAAQQYFAAQPGRSGAGIETCFHISIALKSMTQFAEMNALYIQAFASEFKALGHTPPSRACIEAAIPWDIELTVHQTCEPDASAKGIHVQGLSYWAPASIGPYSQCRLMFGVSYVAGQIGLIPQSLNLVCGGVAAETVLALQNAVRILNVAHESAANWTPRMAIAYITTAAALPVVQRVWSRFASVPLVTAVVSALPRGAHVEWALQACDRRYFSYFVPDSDEDEAVYSDKPEILHALPSGYVHRAGFQVLQVRCNAPLRDASLVFSAANRATASRHWVPVQAVYYNGARADEVYVSY